MRITVVGIAPAASAAVVEHDALAGLHRDPVGGVTHAVRVVAAVAQDHLVGGAVAPAADTGHRVLHADHVRVDLRVDEHFLLVVAAADSAPLPGSAGVGAVVAAPLDVRVERLVDLGGRLPEVSEAGVEGAPCVHSHGGVAPARVDLGGVIGEGHSGARVDTADDGGDAGLVGLRDGAFRQHVLHRDRDHFAHVGARVVRSRAHGLARIRIEDATLRDHELDLFEEAFVLRDLGIHHRRDLPDRVPAGVAVGGPRLELGPGVGTGEVDGQRVAVDRHRDVQVYVGVSERIMVDVGVTFVHTVGPLHDLFAEAAGRVVDHRIDAGLHGLRVEALDDVAEAADAELRRTDLGVQVTDVAGDAVVGCERVEDVATFDTAVDDLHDRPPHTFAPNVGRGDVVAAGHAATGVAVVALDARDQHHAASAVGCVGEHGREHVVVGEVTAAVVRVVGDEHVAFAELVDAEELECEPDRQGRGEHELRDADRERGEPAGRVEDRRVALVRLVENRCGGGTRHVLRHLEADGLHAAADDFRGHGIHCMRRREPAATSGQANKIDVGHGAPKGREPDVSVRSVTRLPIRAQAVASNNKPAMRSRCQLVVPSKSSSAVARRRKRCRSCSQV